MMMTNYHKSLALFAVIVTATPAFAGDIPPPRTPIGPKDVMEMLPRSDDPLSLRSRPLASDRARITNQGNQQLSILYWDGAAWQQASIATGRVFDAVCSRCAGDIPVAFHNGKEDKTLKVRGGASYELRWDTQAGIWNLAASAR